ncbi:biopolymer transporter ExbD [Pelagicoccus sp. SDUM812003]|uniref:ExbD/TolR family protein n=1 Tax=Pelagicoccus sp. SDUM812003 TaxID=3041267 RepID=UPI00280EF966|nr:biopolymer transporter ExbD [Pelagicoccus sp. SDUM812003]MDQ8204772.1 biopolymer transporter ExbD [Pelagicoccus sp. SDUM812003]
MIKEKLRDESNEQVEINLSPMIDCIFILLIFFILTTVFVEETGIEVNKPNAANSVMLEKNSVLIAINAQDKVYYGGHEIGISGVRPVVEQALSNTESSIIIQADRLSTHQTFSEVYGEAKAAGAERIQFSTNKSD